MSSNLWDERSDAKPERFFEMKNSFFGVIVVIVAIVLKAVRTVTVHCPNDQAKQNNYIIQLSKIFKKKLKLPNVHYNLILL